MTALSPSGGCYSDIQVYVSYGGYTSAAFNVTIVVPETTYLQSGYPQNNALYVSGLPPGFQSAYAWTVVDSCGYLVSGIDANESFGTFHNDTSNNWITTPPNGVYLTSYLVGDLIFHAGGSPTPEPPQTPLTSSAIRHDYPWAIRVGSQTSGSGTPVRADTQQWWLDHGSHY
ncbi:MAG: hypothetical protein ACRD30_04105, partial [Bryobacteraceae bacterium]